MQPLFIRNSNLTGTLYFIRQPDSWVLPSPLSHLASCHQAHFLKYVFLFCYSQVRGLSPSPTASSPEAASSSDWSALPAQPLPRGWPPLTPSPQSLLLLPQSLSFPSPPAPAPCPFGSPSSPSVELPPLPHICVQPPAFLFAPLLGALQTSVLRSRHHCHLSSDLRLPEGRTSLLFLTPQQCGSGGLREWWGKEGSVDGRRGAKSGVDREGRQGQDREVDRGGQGAGRMGASAGQTPHPKDHAPCPPGPLEWPEEGMLGEWALLDAPTALTPGDSCPFSVGGNWALWRAGNLSLGLEWGRWVARVGGRGGQGKPRSQKNSSRKKRGGGWRLGAGP